MTFAMISDFVLFAFQKKESVFSKEALLLKEIGFHVFLGNSCLSFTT